MEKFSLGISIIDKEGNVVYTKRVVDAEEDLTQEHRSKFKEYHSRMESMIYKLFSFFDMNIYPAMIGELIDEYRVKVMKDWGKVG